MPAVVAAEFLGVTPQFVGEIALIALAGVMVGFFIMRIWPKHLVPHLFATVIPLAGLALAAYLGSVSAAFALAILAVIAGAAFFFGLA